MGTQTLVNDINPDNYRFLQQYVYSHVGIVLDDSKQYLFQSRLANIVKQHSLGSINELCTHLQTKVNSVVGHQIVEAMTTNETYFFRDPAHYEAIRNFLLPRLKEERKGTRSLRFWSAAASTGQEAYSLAMLLRGENLPDWNIQILGTDFSSVVVERAKSATYQQIEVNRGLPAALLVKYFLRKGMEWQLNDEIRNMARFETIDLRNSMRTLGPFDLVFCRNVLIYFDNETKRRILKELHSTLFRGGWLLLGGSETAFGVDEWFDKQSIGNTTVYIAR